MSAAIKRRRSLTVPPEALPQASPSWQLPQGTPGLPRTALEAMQAGPAELHQTAPQGPRQTLLEGPRQTAPTRHHPWFNEATQPTPLLHATQAHQSLTPTALTQDARHSRNMAEQLYSQQQQQQQGISAFTGIQPRSGLESFIQMQQQQLRLQHVQRMQQQQSVTAHPSQPTASSASPEAAHTSVPAASSPQLVIPSGRQPAAMPLNFGFPETRPYATQVQTAAGVEPESVGTGRLTARVGAVVNDAAPQSHGTASLFTEETSLSPTPQSPGMAPTGHEVAQSPVGNQAAVGESNVPAGGTGQQPPTEGKASD